MPDSDLYGSYFEFQYQHVVESYIKLLMLFKQVYSSLFEIFSCFGTLKSHRTVS